jgi:flagellar protein FliS
MQRYWHDPGKEYIKSAVMTAGPAELIAMLYDAGVKNLKLAMLSYEENKDICATSNYLLKAQKIISELMNCLDMNYDLSKDLLAIYEFILNQLRIANARKDMQALPSISDILESMGETWHAVARTQRERMVAEC